MTFTGLLIGEIKNLYTVHCGNDSRKKFTAGSNERT
jgi:hypothetical protein